MDSFGYILIMAKIIFYEHQETLYCACKYNNDNEINLSSCNMQSAASIQRAHRLEWEHMMPAENLGQHLLCWKKSLCTINQGKAFKGRKCCEKIDEKLVYKYIFLKRLMPTFQKYNLTFANCKSAYELVEFIDQHFISFSKNIIFDTEWRGEKIIENSVFDDQLVKFNEIEPVTFTPSNLFLFLSSKLYFKQNRSKLFSKFLSLLQLLLIDRFSFYRKLFIQPIQIK